MKSRFIFTPAFLMAALLAATGVMPAAAFVRRKPLIPTAQVFPSGLIAAMLAVPVPNLDWHVALVDGTGTAFGTVGNPIFTSVSGGGSATSATDEGAWTAGVSLFNPIGGVFNDTAAALTTGQQGTERLTPNRAGHVNLRTQAGTEIGLAASPLFSQLSDGAAGYTGTKTGQLPTALVGGRLDVNIGASGATVPISAASLPLPTGASTEATLAAQSAKLPAALVGGRLDVNLGQIPGTISTVNSSTATLGGNAVFTGTGEDVSAYAAIEVAVFSDVASAASGVSAQWSEDNTNWDFTSVGTLAAGVGQSFMFHPRAKFFRMVYTNGAGAQAAFRLQTIYHPVGLPGGVGVNAQQAQGSVPNASTVVGSNSFIMGVTDASNLARYLLSASANTDAEGGINAFSTGGLGFNGTTYDRLRTTPGATATTGTGLLGTGPLLWDSVGATNFVKQAGDGSGRAMVVGPAAVGAAISGNPLALAIKDPSGNVQYVAQAPTATSSQAQTGALYTGISLNQGSGNSSPLAAASLIADNVAGVNSLAMGLSVLNGTNYDRVRNNVDSTVLASAARTTTQTSADIVTYNCHSLMAVLDMTTVGTGSVTLTINYKDPASGKYILLLSGAAVVTNSTNLYRINPNIAAVANSVAQSDLGRIIQLVVTANNANSATYSLGLTLVN